jgi:predicted RNA-binding protein with PUA-like domain
MEVVGIARVIREAYPDPTTDDARWVAVDLVPHHTLKKSVTLVDIKNEPMLAQIGLIRQGRLSVMPLRAEEFDKIVEMGS